MIGQNTYSHSNWVTIIGENTRTFEENSGKERFNNPPNSELVYEAQFWPKEPGIFFLQTLKWLAKPS